MPPVSDPVPAGSASPGVVESKLAREYSKPVVAANTFDDAGLANRRMMERMEEIHTLFQIQGDLLDEEPRARLINEFETLGRKVERYRRAMRATK